MFVYYHIIIDIGIMKITRAIIGNMANDWERWRTKKIPIIILILIIIIILNQSCYSHVPKEVTRTINGLAVQMIEMARRRESQLLLFQLLLVSGWLWLYVCVCVWVRARMRTI